jgi:quercetin dioxygenase-like cupin family protein
MSHRTVPSFAVFSALFLIASGQSSRADTPLAATAIDPKLQWGPCPDFMPKGCGIAVLYGDPSKSNADVFFKIPAKTEAPQHWHTSAERMVLVSGQLKVSYDGQPTVTLRPGMYAYGPPRHAHSAVCVSDDDCVLFIAFESPVDAVAGTGKVR